VSFLLDTCVVSELMKRIPHASVVGWVNQTPETATYLSVLTLGELKRGIEKQPVSPRRLALEQWLQADIIERFQGRLISLDADSLLTWGALQARLEATGRKMPAIDGLLAASALQHGLTLVTRNVSDFEATGVPLLNPWE
jgi:predicted nucleic acid-binding protein